MPVYFIAYFVFWNTFAYGDGDKFNVPLVEHKMCLGHDDLIDVYCICFFFILISAYLVFCFLRFFVFTDPKCYDNSISKPNAN